MVTVDALTRLLQARPFRRFRIHLADGRSLTVDHPDYMARSPTGRTAVVYGEKDSFEIIDLELVTNLETLAEADDA